MPPPWSESQSADTLVVEVIRTGGFAGLRRRWAAEPLPDERERWTRLLDRCPWDAPSRPARPSGPDRFSWSIRARCGADDQAVTLPDGALKGPWRALVDEVRAWQDGPTSPEKS